MSECFCWYGLTQVAQTKGRKTILVVIVSPEFLHVRRRPERCARWKPLWNTGMAEDRWRRDSASVSEWVLAVTGVHRG